MTPARSSLRASPPTVGARRGFGLPCATGVRTLVLACICLAAASAGAQAPAAAPPLVGDNPAPQGRADKRIEHIRIEDKGARIDELRYGGEPQSITVKPLNSAMPSYEIVPNNGARVRPGNERDAASGNAGQRVWNVLGF